jgi:hypothetical protein
MRSLRVARRRLSTLLLGGGLVAVGAVALRRRSVAREIEDARRRLDRTGTAPDQAVFDPERVAALPAPIRRYLERVLEPEQAPVERVELAQAGEFRFGDTESSWRPFEATQVYTVSPPGFVWDAVIQVLPHLSARVLDAYVDGDGLLRANLLGAVPVASAGPDRRMNEAELQRYLSETPWFPTALLPGAGVTWEGIDDRSARATLTDGDVTATATFHVDGDGLLEELTADRYRQDVDGTAPWIGSYRAYEGRNGMLVPTEAEVAWEGESGREPYWRGRITAVDHRPARER